MKIFHLIQFGEESGRYMLESSVTEGVTMEAGTFISYF